VLYLSYWAINRWENNQNLVGFIFYIVMN